jgi:hypothetical protein
MHALEVPQPTEPATPAAPDARYRFPAGVPSSASRASSRASSSSAFAPARADRNLVRSGYAIVPLHPALGAAKGAHDGVDETGAQADPTPVQTSDSTHAVIAAASM